MPDLGTYYNNFGVSTLEDILSPGSAGEVVRSTGSAWASSTLAFNDLGDLSVGSPAAGDIAIWDGSSAWQKSKRAWAVGTGTTTGINLENTTAAGAGAQQYSPVFSIIGRGYTSADTRLSFGMQVRPTNQTTWDLHFLTRTGTGSWSSVMNLGEDGDLDIADRFTSVDIVTGLGYITLKKLNAGTGLGNCCTIQCNEAGKPFQIYNSNQTNSAGKISIAAIYNLNAAFSTLNDTFEILSVGARDNSSVFNKAFIVHGKCVSLPSFAVADAPSGVNAGSIAWCTNGDAGVACLTCFDGTNWKVIDIDGLSNISAT